MSETRTPADTGEAARRTLAALRELPGAALTVFDRDLRYVFVAGEMLRHTGLDPAALEGKLVAEALPARLWAALERCYRAALEGERATVEVEGAVEGHWYEIDVAPWRDESGQLAGGVTVARDVTDRHLASERLLALLEQSPDAVLVSAADGTIVHLNARAELLFGYPAGELLGAPVGTVLALASDGGEGADGGLQAGASLAPGSGMSELRVRAKNGGELVVEVTAGSMELAGRSVTALAIRDITAQRASQDAAAWLAALVQQSDDAVIGRDLDGIMTSWNEGAERLYGYSAAEAIGRHASLLVPPGWEQDYSDTLERIMRGEVVRRESTRRTKDGRDIVVWVTLSPIRDSLGRVIGSSTVARDISERRRLEEELRVSEERWRALFGAGRLGVAVRDADARLLECNEPFAAMFDATPAALVGTLPSDILAADDAAAIVGEYHERWAPERANFGVERTLTRLDGSRLHVRVTAQSVFDDAGEPKCQVVLLDDVGERKRLEEELAQARRIESIGRLAGVVAHELNNQLAVILGRADQVSQQLDHDDGARAALHDIRGAAAHAGGLIARLLALGRQQVLEPALLPASELAAGLGRLLGPVLGAEIELVVDDRAGAALVRADRGQLEQVLLAVAANAREAMVAGGRLTVLAEASRSAAGAPLVAFSFSDTGTGMSEEVRARIFEPFYTTKDFGTGAGLGLSSALGIVEQSGGSITVDSAPGRGTTVRIELPALVSAGQSGGETQQVAPASSARALNVLLVEDEEQVRRLVVRLLSRAGHRVLAVASGAEALQVLRSAAQPLDLLLTDAILPDVHGGELARQAQELRPGLVVIYASGYPGESVIREGIPPGDGFLAKPFTAHELEAAIALAFSTRADRA